MNRKEENFINTIGNRLGILRGVLVGAIIITSCIVVYFFLAFDTVGYNQFGLNHNDITQEIEDKVYERGFYHTGIFNHFIKFPKTVQTMNGTS